MAVRKTAVKKSVKTAARRARRRRLSRAPKRPAMSEPDSNKRDPRPQAVLPVPIATFVF